MPIRHIALYTPDPQRPVDFYCHVLDMKEVERTDRSSIFVSDAHVNLAFLYQRKDEPIGLNHFGFHVKNNEEMQTRAEKAGVGRGAHGQIEFLLRSTVFMILKATASTFRKKAGMCKTTTKGQTVSICCFNHFLGSAFSTA